MKIVSSFTYPLVISNLFRRLSSAKHKRGYFEESWNSIGTHSLLLYEHKTNASEWVPVPNILQNIFLFSAEERKSYRFEITRGWVNDDTIFIFGWTVKDSSIYRTILIKERKSKVTCIYHYTDTTQHPVAGWWCALFHCLGYIDQRVWWPPA